MAATRSGVGMPVLALKRPQHDVELFNFALHNDCVLIVSEKTSKDFICFQIIDEFLQNESNLWAVVLIDGYSGLDAIPLVKMLTRLLPRKPVVFPNLCKATLPCHKNQNVLVISSNDFKHCLMNKHINTSEVSVVMYLSTLNTITKNYSPILKMLCKKHVKQRIVTLIQLALSDVNTASDLRTKLELLERTYNLPIFMSKDVLAMNAYGEEIVVKTLPYNAKGLTPIERKIWKILNETSGFLQDINIAEISKTIRKVRAVVLWAIEVLLMFGLWSLSFMFELIQNTLLELLNKENNIFVQLAIEACRTQFDLIQKIVKDQSKAPAIHSCLIHEIFDSLSAYKELCNTSSSIGEHGVEIDHDNEDDGGIYEQASFSSAEQTVQRRCVLADENSSCNSQEEDNTRSDTSPFIQKGSMGSVQDMLFLIEKRLQKLKNKSQFHCIIVTKSNNIARILSKLINYMSVCNQKYSFIKCGCAIQPRDGNLEEIERTESVLQAVIQGMVNIIVTTVDLVSDLSLTTFNVLMFFGIPSSYAEYYKLKYKVKGLAAKLMLVFNDDHSVRCQKNLEVFCDIESEIAKRVSDYITQERKEQLLKYLVKESLCSYKPFGDDGPSVSMESSVHLVNKYCRRINRGDFCNINAHFETEKKKLTENCLEFVSTLYLPLGNPCCSTVVGAPVKVYKEDSLGLEFGILKSRMLASLDFVKILHNCHKMDEDLDLIEEVYIDVNSENMENMEDGEKGRPGTNKRRRAYEIKVPSFFNDNMPRMNETCFLYKIEFDDPALYKHSRSRSLQTLLEPEFELGILSRKPLPKMPSFLVHTCKSDVSVCLRGGDPVKIDETTLKWIRLFHHYVFKQLHKLDYHSTELSETDGYLAVPLVRNTTTSPSTPSAETTTVPNAGFEIHYKILQEFSSYFESTTDPDLKLKSSRPCKDYNFFQNKIVSRLNKSANQTHYTRYFVLKVCPDLSPASQFPNQEVASTFAEYYKIRYDIQVNLEQPLLQVQHLPTQVNFIVPRLQNQPTEDHGGIVKENKMEIHLIPELCSILPLSASAWSLTRFLPAVVFRLEAMLRAHEMKLKILSGISKESRNCVGTRYSPSSHIGGGNKGDSKDHSGHDGSYGDNKDHNDGSDGDHKGHDNGDDVGPSILLILHALTAKSAGQHFHSEQLELLGDSCLKLEVSLELFLSDPEKDEWTLSVYRKCLVSNHMLSTQGRRLGIPEYISIATPDLSNTSLPPGIILENCSGVKESVRNLYTHQVLGDKNVANTVEALIAAVLVGCGRNAARQFLIWLGVARYSSDDLVVFFESLMTRESWVNAVNKKEIMSSKVEQRDSACNNKDSKTLSSNSESQQDKSGLMSRKTEARPIPNFDHIEKALGYSFKNKLVLLQALTHNSYPRSLSLVSETYQKMEFLGDAILDFLVTRYLFERFPNLNHGDVTDFRSGLVNNFTLAFLAVQKNLHQSLRHMSPQLLHVIDQFLEFLEEQELKKGASWKTSVDAFVVGAPEVEDSLIEVPKVLGDVFEAVVCAVFLDSGMDLDHVWKIYQPLFMPFIEYYKDNIPRSPIRILKETFPEGNQVIFSSSRLTLSRTYKSSVIVSGYGRFEAIGRTPKIAKSSVARKALQHIRNVSAKQT